MADRRFIWRNEGGAQDEARTQEGDGQGGTTYDRAFGHVLISDFGTAGSKANSMIKGNNNTPNDVTSPPSSFIVGPGQTVHNTAGNLAGHGMVQLLRNVAQRGEMGLPFKVVSQAVSQPGQAGTGYTVQGGITDGDFVIVSLQTGGASNIYLPDLRNSSEQGRLLVIINARHEDFSVPGKLDIYGYEESPGSGFYQTVGPWISSEPQGGKFHLRSNEAVVLMGLADGWGGTVPGEGTAYPGYYWAPLAFFSQYNVVKPNLYTQGQTEAVGTGDDEV